MWQPFAEKSPDDLLQEKRKTVLTSSLARPGGRNKILSHCLAARVYHLTAVQCFGSCEATVTNSHKRWQHKRFNFEAICNGHLWPRDSGQRHCHPVLSSSTVRSTKYKGRGYELYPRYEATVTTRFCIVCVGVSESTTVWTKRGHGAQVLFRPPIASWLILGARNSML